MIKQPAYNLINVFVNIVILWAVYKFFFLNPRYTALFLFNGTSANCICEAGAEAGNQVCCRTRPEYYTEAPHFSGRVSLPPSLMTGDSSDVQLGPG